MQLPIKRLLLVILRWWWWWWQQGGRRLVDDVLWRLDVGGQLEHVRLQQLE